MSTCRTCGNCGAPAVHADSFHGSIRMWCEKCTPWSGHYEDCPVPCDELMGRQGKAEMEKRVTSRKLVSEETSFTTNAKNHISVKFDSDGDKAVLTLVIDATNSYVLSHADIADLVSILQPYMPPRTRSA